MLIKYITSREWLRLQHVRHKVANPGEPARTQRREEQLLATPAQVTIKVPKTYSQADFSTSPPQLASCKQLDANPSADATP